MTAKSIDALIHGMKTLAEVNLMTLRDEVSEDRLLVKQINKTREELNMLVSQLKKKYVEELLESVMEEADV